MSGFTTQDLNTKRESGEPRKRGRGMRSVTALAALAAVVCGTLGSAVPASAGGVTGEMAIAIAVVPGGYGAVDLKTKRAAYACDSIVDGVRVETRLTFSDGRTDSVTSDGVGCKTLTAAKAPIVNFVVCSKRGATTLQCVGGPRLTP